MSSFRVWTAGDGERPTTPNISARDEVDAAESFIDAIWDGVYPAQTVIVHVEGAAGFIRQYAVTIKRADTFTATLIP